MYKSIYVTKQLSNDKITFISFCCKYIVVWSRPETIAMADDVWKEVMEHMMISVLHFTEHYLDVIRERTKLPDAKLKIRLCVWQY